MLAAEDRFAPAGGGLFLVGIALGVVAALVGDFNLTAPWLLIAYVLSAIILINAFAYHIPTANKLKALAEASPDDEASSELRAAVRAPIGPVMNVIDGVVWLALIFVMVAKPFG